MSVLYSYTGLLVPSVPFNVPLLCSLEFPISLSSIFSAFDGFSCTLGAFTNLAWTNIPDRLKITSYTCRKTYQIFLSNINSDFNSQIIIKAVFIITQIIKLQKLHINKDYLYMNISRYCKRWSLYLLYKITMMTMMTTTRRTMTPPRIPPNAALFSVCVFGDCSALDGSTGSPVNVSDLW